LRVGYLSGTTTHDDDWRYVEPAVVDVLDRHPEVELWLAGHLPTTPELTRFGDRVRRLPFVPWQELPGMLRDLDVNLAPLEPHGRFNEGKSAIKWLEAALCGTVTVASPTEPFRLAIEPGVNGLLAATTAEWIDTLDRLLSDDLLRGRLGHRARRDALLGWSPHLQASRYLGILTEAQRWRTEAGARRARASSWTPVAHDEPLIDAPLEPYEDEVAPPTNEQIPIVAGAFARVRESLRRDGTRATGRRVVNAVARRLGLRAGR
jgi:hypothetical protein